jgi:glycosyltransferase involved in cell wall biosynthesis
VDDTPLVTVLTATFNRRALLGRLHADLCAQTYPRLEWVVVDDGSTDGTMDDVRVWTQQTALAIRAVRQDNAGKHVALNTGIREARGEYVLIIDSDDRCPPDAVEAFVRAWASIPAEQREQFSNVSALCARPDGSVIGPPFPHAVVDTVTVADHLRLRDAAERCGMSRTAVLRACPFPQIPGERFIAEGVVWNRLARKYRARFVNQVLQVKDFQPDGLTDNIRRLRVENPRGATLYYREAAQLPVPWRLRLRAAINYVRFGHHAGLGSRQLLADGPFWLSALALLPGLFACRLDRRVLGRLS